MLLVAAVCAQQQQSALGPQLVQQQGQANQQNAQQNQESHNRDQNQQNQQSHQNQSQQSQRDSNQQQQQQQQQDQAERYEHDPQYDYSYIVQDNLTGDNKQQEESRRGGRVRGQYSLIDADG